MDTNAAGPRPIPIDARTLFLCHCALIVALAAAHWLALISGSDLPFFNEEFVQLRLDLALEATPATFISTCALLSCGLVALHLQRTRPDPEGSMFWATAGGLLLFMAFDEAAKIHEGFVVIGKYLVPHSGIFYFNWWVGYVPAVLLVAVWLIPGLLRATPDVRLGLVLGGMIFVVGALGMECVESVLTYQRDTGQGDPEALRLQLHRSVLIEETLEMLGVAITLRTLLERAARTAATAAVHIVAAGAFHPARESSARLEADAPAAAHQ